MNPYPLSALNHLTVPVAMDETPPPLLGNGQRRRLVRIRLLAQVVPGPYQASTTLQATGPPERPTREGPVVRALGDRGSIGFGRRACSGRPSVWICSTYWPGGPPGA